MPGAPEAERFKDGSPLWPRRETGLQHPDFGAPCLLLKLPSLWPSVTAALDTEAGRTPGGAPPVSVLSV